MAYTQATLVLEVLRELSAVDANTTDPNAVATEDSAVVVEILTGVLAEMAERRIVVVSNPDAIPDSVFTDLVVVLAERAAPRFGRPTDPKNLDAAWARLASVVRLDRSQASKLVLAVLEQLDAWGAGSLAVDAVAVASEIEGQLANLAARNVIYIADEDDLLDNKPGAFPPVKRLIAGWLAVPTKGDVVMQAESELRTLQRIGKGTGRKLRVDPALRSSRFGGLPGYRGW